MPANPAGGPRPASSTRAAASTYPPIIVLFGGPSAEHDVSIVSGTAIGEALRDRGLHVQPVLIDLGGAWWWLPPEHRRAGRPASDYDDPGVLAADGPWALGPAIERLQASDPPALVFIALHGPFGEDGVIQGLLEATGMPYTGPGVAASAIGMDKAIFKRLVRGLGLPVTDWREIPLPRWAAERDGVLAELAAFAAANGDERLMIKPARLGSSIGMSIAHGAAERGPALDEAFRFDSLALAERYVPAARELEVAVLGDGGSGLEEYGPGEIISGREFYDYVAKYTPGLSETAARAELEPGQRALIRKLARDAYRAIGAEGFARVDFLVGADQVYVSEINTMPGFTPISLFPAMASDGGYDFAGVCLRIVDLALERHARRAPRMARPEDLPR